jgi:precorrin-6Y C5,15-methyltransferase (decarboxylating)
MSRREVLVFGGTIEGRQLSEYLSSRKIPHTLCVATEYGEEVVTAQEYLTVHQGRMDVEEMRSFLRTGDYCAVVDATHPYAVAVSQNIRNACEKEQMTYLRYLRPQSVETIAENKKTEKSEKNKSASANEESSNTLAVDHMITGDAEEKGISENIGSSHLEGYPENSIFVNSAKEAAEYLETQTGQIFLTTGSKELHVFTEIISDRSRLFARVLPSAEVIASCRALGLEGKQICGMQGPFSAEINEAMMRQTGAAFLVTKDTGTSGGFPEKMEAVVRLGVHPVIIRRPQESGLGWEEVLRHLEEVLAHDEVPRKPESVLAHDEVPRKLESVLTHNDAAKANSLPHRSISCIGIGMGTLDTLTYEAADAIRKADILFGAGRILDSVQAMKGLLTASQTLVREYEGRKIAAYLAEHPQYQRIAILMSGDVGFYSGARGIGEAFPKEQVQYYCGISSIVYFASKIPSAWQDAKLVSAHGKTLAVLNHVNRYRKLILLVSGREDVERICAELHAAQQDQVRVTVGTNLSYPEETIRSGAPVDFLNCTTTGLHIMMIENPQASYVVTPGIPDDAFVRGKVPMTKEEIRILSIAKLRLQEDSVVYDVGAGTGSVSAEAARLCSAGTVYAIERNPEGVSLIRENGRRLCLSNLVAVEGTAPEALEALPAPTHAFIGGSSGNMRQILELLRAKNPKVRIVLNTIALESIAEVMNVIRDLEITDAEIVQVSAAKAKTLGRYHMMNALNPIYIVSFGG